MSYNNNRTPANWTPFKSSNGLNVSFSDKGAVKLTRTTLSGQEQLICFMKGDDLQCLIQGAEAVAEAQEHYNNVVKKNKELDKAKAYANKQVNKVLETQIKGLQASIDSLKIAGVAETDLTVVSLKNTIAQLSSKIAA